MRRSLDKPFVWFSADISAEDHDLLSNLVPMVGVKSLIITQGLQSFLERAENAPAGYRDWLSSEVSRMTREEAPPRRQRTLSAKIPTDLYVRFGQILPQVGGSTWFLRRYIHALVLHLKDNTTLVDQIQWVVGDTFHPPAVDELAETIHQGPDE